MRLHFPLVQPGPFFAATIAALITIVTLSILSACNKSAPVGTPTSVAIDRQTVVERHNPKLDTFDPQAPFTLGNGHFAFTADITGLQSYADIYYQQGIPLETKARWAWHSRENPNNFKLGDANENYEAYGREVAFPTHMDSEAAQWLRKNPHDLPLARIGFSLDGNDLKDIPENIQQTLNIWAGELSSAFSIENKAVKVRTLVDSQADQIAASIQSELLGMQRLAVDIRFPRGYKLDLKNTPDIDFINNSEHKSEIARKGEHELIFKHTIDNATHWLSLRWQGKAELQTIAEHHYRLLNTSNENTLNLVVHFSQTEPTQKALSNNSNDYQTLANATAADWQKFWTHNAFVDFTGSTNPQANELERRIILSRYLMAVQERAGIPPQESGLTHSSWYGKHHSEMSWWHSAHWIYWGQAKETEKLLQRYNSHLASAQDLAKQRGLQGARWAKMIGPENRESPGGNALIIWNQPQPIHLAEMLYQAVISENNDEKNESKNEVLEKYAAMVEETAQALASMLVWNEESGTYNLEAPIWIAQEIYDPRITKNPGFELAYWKTGLELAQRWRERLGKARSTEWQDRIDKLAPLPVKDEKYVAIESVPDTFDNIASRQDHPSMLAAFGLLNDDRVDQTIMRNSLHAVINTWDWQTKIWGWDYPMIAMTAARLGETQLAVDTLLANSTHNHYLINGHVPQEGAALRVYLPANGALLSAVAMMLVGWEGAPDHDHPGFPDDETWKIKTEGFTYIPL